MTPPAERTSWRTSQLSSSPPIDGLPTIVTFSTQIVNYGTQNSPLTISAGADGSGRVALAAANTYTGETTVEAGAELDIGGGASGGSIQSENIDNEGLLRFWSNSFVSFAGQISGTGTVSQYPGTATLYGNNTYTGPTTIEPVEMNTVNYEQFLFENFNTAPGELILAPGSSLGNTAITVEQGTTFALSLALGSHKTAAEAWLYACRPGFFDEPFWGYLTRRIGYETIAEVGIGGCRLGEKNCASSWPTCRFHRLVMRLAGARPPTVLSTRLPTWAC